MIVIGIIGKADNFYNPMSQFFLEAQDCRNPKPKFFRGTNLACNLEPLFFRETKIAAILNHRFSANRLLRRKGRNEKKGDETTGIPVQCNVTLSQPPCHKALQSAKLAVAHHHLIALVGIVDDRKVFRALLQCFSSLPATAYSYSVINVDTGSCKRSALSMMVCPLPWHLFNG